MKYNCSNCDYSTDDCSNWSKHNKSKSHLKKVQTQPNSVAGQLPGQLPGHVADENNINKSKLICPYCDQSFSSNQSLSRHKNHRCSKNIIDEKNDDSRVKPKNEMVICCNKSMN